MTQYVINIGALPNDGTGDPLRTAFNDVNLNFNQVWATGLIGSNIAIANNTILTTNTNGNLILNPNGVGNIQANAHILPDQNRVRNLGSSTRRWDSLYVQYANVAGNLDLAGTFSVGDLSVTGNLTVTGNTIQIGNLITDAKTIQLANTASTANAANGSGVTVGSNDSIATMLYNSTSNVWTMNIGVSSVGNITAPYFIGNGSQLTGIAGSYSNANVVAYGESGWAGNIIPTGNAVYSLGNSTNQWGDLFVSNATIYMNNIPISLTSANVLTVAGQALLSNDSNTTITTTGNITANVISATGNVEGNNLSIASNAYVLGNITGSYFFGDASYMTGVITGNTLSDPVLYVANDTLTAPGLNGAGYAIGNAAGTLITMLYNNDANSLQFNRGLVPSANTTSDIGNSTLYWNNLYVGNILTGSNITLPPGGFIKTVSGNGNINLSPDGIGSTTIQGNGAILLNVISDQPNRSGRIQVDTFGNTGNTGGTFTGSYSRGTSYGNYTAVLANDQLAGFRGRGYDGAELALPTGLISIDAADNWSPGYTPTRINFWTTNGSGNANINMQINPNGNVYVYNGNLIVTGGGGYLQGNDVTGNGGLYAGIPGFTPLGSNVVAQFAGNANSYSQVNFQNINSGNIASGDIIVTADNGDDSNNFINMGIASSTWDGTQDNSLGTDVSANDGYLYVNGANLVVGTAITGGAVNTWKFDTAGNLTAGNNLNFNGGGIQQVLNEDFYVRVSDDEDEGWTLYNVVDDGAGAVLTQTRLDNSGFYIQTDVPSSNYQWNFNAYQGITNFPGNLQGIYGGDTSFYAYDNGSGGMVEMKTISYIGDQLLANVTVRHPNVTISTQNSLYNWTFDGTGNLVLPLSGNLVGATANNSGHINWFGNSSGDGAGYTTLRLVPDDTRESSDQYLIIDPTAPGHIHIRAGGTQDNSNADLFLGGENSYFKVNAGANNEVRISANSYAWTFGADSILTVPNEGVIRSIQDTVILQSYDINGNTYSARLGTTGGMYFETTEYPGGWLSLTNNAGNANITAASGTAGSAGKNIYITAGSADQGDYYTTPGGDVNITGGLGATNDGGGGGPGGNVNITAGLSADPAGVAGNVTIGSGTNYWQFVNNGNLYVPGQINGDNNGALVIDGAGYGNGYISLPASSFGGEQIAIVNDFSLGNGIRLQTNGGNLFFDNDGDLSVTGNISTTGNVTAGNLSVTGNVVGNINFTGGDVLINNATGAGGSDEGGELHFAAATANSTLSGPIAIDIYQSKMRFFETEGNTFGMYVDIANTAMGVAGSSLGVPAIGYRDVPQISLSANVTANVTNAGKHFYSTTAGNITLTIPDNANVAFPTGATLTIVMNAAGNVIVAQGTGVSLYMAGSSTTGNRVVGAYGLASVMKVATDTWVISGTGVY